MDPIIKSIQRLSEAASDALLLLEKYDYRKEADSFQSERLPLKVSPKTFKEITDSLTKFVAPITYDGERIPDDALLDKENLEIFVENLEISGDKTVLRQFNHIDLEPIKDVAQQLEQLGAARLARLISNVYNFADELRSNGRKYSIRPKDANQAPIHIDITLTAEEMTDEEQLEARKFQNFNGIFRPGVLNTAQRKALYNAFRNCLAENQSTKPHLVIIAAICLMMNLRSYGKPLDGTFHGIRKTVFTSLDQPETTGKSYKQTSLKKDESPSLYNYKETAALLLSQALGMTR